jgi:pyruvate formate lyase activating enzyme
MHMPQGAMVFDVQRFAIHDGPGIRTTVFLKGCSNKCGWCHNPESITGAPQIQFYPDRCVGCGKCAAVCAHPGACVGCGKCAMVCDAHARVLCGRRMTAEEAFQTVLEDAPYYKASGGGMTVSGGEPALQSDFCAALFGLSRRAGIHGAVETAGNYPYEKLRAFIRDVDLVLFDLKAFSQAPYARHIHGDRARIFETLRSLDAEGVPIIVRTPVVGGVNDAPAEIEAIARHLSTLHNLLQYQLIPYHALGKAKYDALSLPYDNAYFTPDADALSALERVAARHVKVFNPKVGFIKGGR